MTFTQVRVREPATAVPRAMRRDIQGLRAMAAILVAVYHVFTDRASGAVDVFFVVAGMLVTLALVHHIEVYGRPRAGLYLSRLVGRLMPQALLVLVVTGAMVLVLSPEAWRSAWLDQVAASAVYAENWALISQSVEYLAGGEPDSPVQHFWALSLQGQFYVIWLLVVAGVVAMTARHRRVLPAVVAALLAASLTWSVLFTIEDQPVAYFHTGARLWEFAAGGLIALLVPGIVDRGGDASAGIGGRGSQAVRAAASWIGLGMVVSGGLVFDVAAEFPGWAALWPVLGASLVLVCGRGPAAPWSATRVLGSRPLVWLGGISYGIYLWHWPILAFYRQHALEQGMTLTTGLTIIVAAVALAALSTYAVEHRVRRAAERRLRPWPLVAAGVAAAVAVAVACEIQRDRWDAVVVAQENAPIDRDLYPGGADPIGAPATTPQPAATEGPQFVPTLSAVKKARPAPREEGCQLGPLSEEPLVCHYGDPDGRLRIVMVGGSHSTHLFTPVEALALEHGWRLDYIARTRCRLSSGDFGPTSFDETCEEWNRRVMRLLQEDPPDVVIALGTVSGSSNDEETADHETLPEGFLEAWDALGRAGIKVLAMRDTPRWRSDPINCLSVERDDPSRCAQKRSETLADVSPLATRGDLPRNVFPVDLTPHLCTETECPAVVGGVVAYFDRGHLSEAFASSLTDPLEDEVLQALEAWRLV